MLCLQLFFPHLHLPDSPSIHLFSRRCLCHLACRGSLPCLEAGVRSAERALDRQSAPWQNRNRSAWRELTQQASSSSLYAALSVALPHFYSLHLLAPASRRTHKVLVTQWWRCLQGCESLLWCFVTHVFTLDCVFMTVYGTCWTLFKAVTTFRWYSRTFCGMLS